MWKNHMRESDSSVTKEIENDDLIAEVLIRLPWRSLARFKSVSKQWYWWISDPSFIAKHQARHRPLLGFFYNDSKQVKFLQDVSQDHLNLKSLVGDFGFRQGHCVRVLNSSNGLLLYHSFNRSQSMKKELYVVHNPITKQELCLPAHKPRISSPRRTSSLYGYNPFMVHGFAFDHSSNPPYLIVTELFHGPHRLQVNSYSSDTCRWRSREHDVVPFLGKKYALTGPSTFLNGSLHWLLEPCGVFAYDIRNEVFSMMEVPGDRDDWYCNNKFSRGTHKHFPPYCNCRYLGESLARLIYIRVAGDNELFLWTLEDYYDRKWSPKYHIVMEILPVPLLFGAFVAFDRKDPLVVYLNLKKKIVSYHLKSGDLKELHDISVDGNNDSDHFFDFICPYELPISPPSLHPECYFSTFLDGSSRLRGTSATNPMAGTDLTQSAGYSDNLHARSSIIQPNPGFPPADLQLTYEAATLQAFHQYQMHPIYGHQPFHRCQMFPTYGLTSNANIQGAGRVDSMVVRHAHQVAANPVNSHCQGGYIQPIAGCFRVNPYPTYRGPMAQPLPPFQMGIGTTNQMAARNPYHPAAYPNILLDQSGGVQPHTGFPSTNFYQANMGQEFFLDHMGTGTNSPRAGRYNIQPIPYHGNVHSPYSSIRPIAGFLPPNQQPIYRGAMAQPPYPRGR